MGAPQPRPRPGSRRPARARLADGHLANVYSAACPSRQALDRLADKWSVLLIGALSPAPQRFGQLRDQIDGISEKMLTRTLRSLERDGLVSREALVDRTVIYRLTVLGRTLQEPMSAIRQWAERYINEIEQARLLSDSVDDRD
ncbi:winged helix-turn-helix transcriptional regulator [Amycolatopsis rifamycinica]|uniref:HxlR family transcriptional regulator n=1 Tax=Amycolatopsis rifamycinica TaxID=287986 RepID=A0A066UBF5_9PSEU|nr:helix-turn-helix domain-containing protein [Amycolatopsis rifamycinica]KDN21568.1 HxlR family transcriptional regulator [Amycolatopsis rifamycinica]